MQKNFLVPSLLTYINSQRNLMFVFNHIRLKKTKKTGLISPDMVIYIYINQYLQAWSVHLGCGVFVWTRKKTKEGKKNTRCYRLFSVWINVCQIQIIHFRWLDKGIFFLQTGICFTVFGKKCNQDHAQSTCNNQNFEERFKHSRTHPLTVYLSYQKTQNKQSKSFCCAGLSVFCRCEGLYQTCWWVMCNNVFLPPTFSIVKSLESV